MTTAAGSLTTQRALPTQEKTESQFRIVMRRFLRHRMAVLSLAFILFVLIVSLLAPLIATFPRDYIDPSPVTAQGLPATKPGPPGILHADGRVHWLGVDHAGRDLFTRVMYGGRISLTIAIFVMLLSETLGVIIGAVAGYYRGWVDSLISRFIEFVLSIPTLPILLIVSAIMIKNDAQLPLPAFVTQALGAVFLTRDAETNKLIVLMLILVAFNWLSAARLMRGMVLSLSEQDFVQSLRAFGASDARIIFRHLIPNGMAPIWVDASLNVGGVIITEAALSFLALGVIDPTPTWGNMLDQARSYMFQNPWLPLVPGIPLVLVSLAFNFFGDGLRDALDPRLKR